MQDQTTNFYQDQEVNHSPVLLVQLTKLPFRKTTPLLALSLGILTLAPLFYLVFFAQSLFVTDPPIALMSLWLDAKAIGTQPPSIETMASSLEAGSYLYLMVLNFCGHFTQTPGLAILFTQGIFAAIMFLPVVYSSAMRFPLIPSLFVSIFILILILNPVGGVLYGVDAISMSVFLWLSISCYARPHKAYLKCAQIEGIFAGLGLWFLYMTSLPLFMAAFVGFVAAMLLQLKRGVVFTSMVVAVVLILSAASEILSFMVIGEGMALRRLTAVAFDGQIAEWGARHWLAMLSIPIGLLLHNKLRFAHCMCLALLLVTGATGLTIAKMDLLPLLIVTSFMALFSAVGRRKYRWIDVTAPREALAGLLAMSFVPMVLSGLDIQRGTYGLLHQFAKAPLTETSELGFSFANEPKIAKMILNREIRSEVANDLDLTPADQAALLKDGLKVVQSMLERGQTTSLVSPVNVPSFYQMPSYKLGEAQYVVTPKISIDLLTDEARMSSQPVLYTGYKRAESVHQVSAAYDIWVKQ